MAVYFHHFLAVNNQQILAVKNRHFFIITHGVLRGYTKILKRCIAIKKSPRIILRLHVCAVRIDTGTFFHHGLP